MNVPTARMTEAPAVILVWDADLGMALEMSLLGAGFGAVLPDAAADLADLPLEAGAPLIICGDMLPKNPRPLIAALRAGGWRGLGVVVTQNAETWARCFEPTDRFAVLEMPFMSHDLIGMILRDLQADEVDANAEPQRKVIAGRAATGAVSA